MNVYSDGAWRPGYLDQTVLPGTVRVIVRCQVAVVPVKGKYFVRPPDPAMLISYLRSLGPTRVFRKVVSRRSESVRNDAWLSVGVGEIEGVEGDSGTVVFVLTSGTQGVERTVVPCGLAHPIERPPTNGSTAPRHVVPGPGQQAWVGLDTQVVDALEPLVGRSAEQGGEPTLPEVVWECLTALATAPSSAFVDLSPPPPSSPVVERIEARVDRRRDRRSLHCFGYGQYAKTQVIPNLSKHVDLACVHEIDPVQLGPVAEGNGLAWDTSGHPRPDEQIENAVVAGYHHVHVPLAVELLDRGVGHVIIEKPIATSTAQVDDLCAAMDRHRESKVHIAFQRRYSPFNEPLLEDLGGGPISMAATVYEVPLPARHWYRWPVVGNAVVSNGCHWIDHFLHLNAYAEAVHVDATRLASQILLAVELRNGASATISLRHEGAPRRGVRDLCVFWNGDSTVVIEDQRRYVAEKGYRVVRRRRCHPYRPVEAMYEEFGRRIALDLPGDPTDHIRRSALLTLELARRLEDAR